MPNRTIKESCRTSETLSKLSDGAERLFWRMTTIADDFGRFESHPLILKNLCFPMHSEKEKPMQKIAQQLKEMAEIGLVILYRGKDNRHYGYFPTWATHQGKARAAKSKYPDPHNAASVYESEKTDVENKGDSICVQMPANVPVVVVESSSSSFEVVHDKSSLRSDFSRLPDSGSAADPWPASDRWLRDFLKTQKLLPLPEGVSLDDPEWWERQSVACGGLSLELLQTEFAKMGQWVTNPINKPPAEMTRGGRPNTGGWKSFIGGWLVRTYQNERRYGRQNSNRNLAVH